MDHQAQLGQSCFVLSDCSQAATLANDRTFAKKNTIKGDGTTMTSNQTTTSGEELTLITGLGGQPKNRRSVEKLCQTRRETNQEQIKRSA